MALPSLRNKGGEITMPTAISKMAEKLEFAKYYIDNSLLPNNINEPHQVIAIIERGIELGLKTREAFEHLTYYPKSGGVLIKSKSYGFFLRRAGYEIKVVSEGVPCEKDGRLQTTLPNCSSTVEIWKKSDTQKILDIKMSTEYSKEEKEDFLSYLITRATTDLHTICISGEAFANQAAKKTQGLTVILDNPAVQLSSVFLKMPKRMVTYYATREAAHLGTDAIKGMEEETIVKNYTHHKYTKDELAGYAESNVDDENYEDAEEV